MLNIGSAILKSRIKDPIPYGADYKSAPAGLTN